MRLRDPRRHSRLRRHGLHSVPLDANDNHSRASAILRRRVLLGVDSVAVRLGTHYHGGCGYLPGMLWKYRGLRLPQAVLSGHDLRGGNHLLRRAGRLHDNDQQHDDDNRNHSRSRLVLAVLYHDYQ